MTQKDLDRVKRAVIRKYPITAGLAIHNVKMEISTEVDTAAVVGEKDEHGVIQVKCIKVNPEFMDNLSFSEQVFVIAHESLHIAFKHFARSIERPERDAERKYKEYCEKESDPAKRERMKVILHNRYHNMWNIATDACINALLRKDGFSFPQGVVDKRTGQPMKFVDMEEGFKKSAEKIYDYLYQKQEEKDKEKEEQKNNQNNQDSQGNQNQQENQSQQEEQKNSGAAPGGTSQGTSSFDDIDIDDYQGFDSHDSWTGEEKDKEKSNNEKSNNEKETDEKENEEIDEESIMEQEKSNQKGESSLKDSFSKARKADGVGKYVPFKPVLSWKRLLEGTLEKVEERWGNRRASRFNPNPRIEERITESKASAEVILDVSGSISVDLLKGFLLQLYPMLEALSEDEEVSIKVGCFSTKFSGWTTIRNKKDIENFEPLIGGGTDFELAATSFSKDPGRTITKIVFTDGCLGNPQKTRVSDIIWIVFGDEMDFVPLGGRIIKVSEKEYRDMINTSLLYQEDQDENSPKTL